MPPRTPKGGQKVLYRRLLVIGKRRLEGEELVRKPDRLAALVEEFQARREAGEKVSIRGFCREHRLVQRQFESRLRPPVVAQPAFDAEAKAAMLAYYQRPEVQEALYLWARGRRLTLHFSRSPMGLGFRSPADVLALAAAGNTSAPTFHASVGRYHGGQLVAFDLVAEIDKKGDWRACFDATRPLVHGLHSLGVPFLVKFSGHSSAHVILPCRGADCRVAAERFLCRVREIMHKTSYLDLSFRDPQHLLRMPYALHERTGLVSLPLTLEEYNAFRPEMARPENVVVDLARLTRVLDGDSRRWLLG